MSSRRPYPTDLSDEEWWILEPLIPEAKPGGRPRAHKTRELLDAIFYTVRGGCAWRLLPHEFPTAGRPSTTTSVSGASMAPGSESTASCVSASARWRVAKKPPARPSWTASR
jgi:transposase